MRAQRVVFPEANQVALGEFEFSTDGLAPSDIAIKTLHSVVSAGTELACLAGTEAWAKPPFYPGYGSVGEVIATGAAVTDVSVGDRVFTYGQHASHARAAQVVTPVPVDLESEIAVFTRMAAVSITALRVSAAELGDYVAVYGLGLVGNFAAQLFTLAGCDVIGIDMAKKRLELATACGVKHTLDPGDANVEEAVADITHGEMCATVVEAIGNPKVGEAAAQLAGKLGEVVLVGSPRGEHEGSITGLLNQVHLWPNGCTTFKGAHEWRYPTRRVPGGQVKHSIERNCEVLLRLMVDGKLHVRELLTHRLPASACAEAYEGLRDRKDEYVGVVLDWT